MRVMQDQNTVGIRSIGTYFPPDIRDSAWISAASGIPEEVIRVKFGVRQIHKAAPEQSVSEMGVLAARNALGDFDPKLLDLVVYCGSEYKDYYLFNCAAKIQNEIGAKSAASFEVHTLCSAGVYSMKILKSMMLQDEGIRYALAVSSSKEGDLINYRDGDSRFMFNFGDGAAAVLLEKDMNKNVILETAMISDGRFADDISVPGVGCKNFANFSDMPPGDRYLRVMDLASMKEQLDPITFDNFTEVIRRAVEKSGYSQSDIGYLAPIFMKRSILSKLLERFSLTEENSYLLDEFGHCQSADTFVSLKEGARVGRLKDGDLAVIVSAGTGYTWAATAIRWG
ncbi:3-oxoacyl-[acyl-carrier-protein] synthase 3 protein 2 [Synergistales bacterium]|nr:3-oxoacyl-[acyl-carrier-protein] synthase 3 protein 2 [Synergistales bacterium]